MDAAIIRRGAARGFSSRVAEWRRGQYVELMRFGIRARHCEMDRNTPPRRCIAILQNRATARVTVSDELDSPSQSRRVNRRIPEAFHLVIEHRHRG